MTYGHRAKGDFYLARDGRAQFDVFYFKIGVEFVANGGGDTSHRAPHMIFNQSGASSHGFKRKSALNCRDVTFSP
jgi:hypothetical protein